MKTIQAIRIQLPKPIPENTSIGLYTGSYIDGNGAIILTSSEFRWSEQQLSGLQTPYTTGLIAESGIGDVTLSGDFKVGGNVSDYAGFDISIINTQQISEYLRTNGIVIAGCICQLWEFIGTEVQSDSVSSGQLFTGVCETPQWTETEIKIPVKSMQYLREANIATVINNGTASTVQDYVADVENNYGVNYPYADDSMNGKIVPCTFGTIDKAKLLRVAAAEVPFTINGTIPDNGNLSAPDYYSTLLSMPGDEAQYKLRYAASDLNYGDTFNFPIIGMDVGSVGNSVYNPLWYTIQISSVAPLQLLQLSGNEWTPYDSCPTFTIPWLIGKYLKVVEGTGKGGRIITGAVFTTNPLVDTIPSRFQKIQITIANIFDTNLAGNPKYVNNYNVNQAATTWVQILDIKRDYAADTWPCKGFN